MVDPTGMVTDPYDPNSYWLQDNLAGEHASAPIGEPTTAELDAEGTGNLLQASSKSEGLASVGDLPENIQSSVKSFFKGGSTKYTDFSVKQESNGNYVASMVKPGNVPGSKAIYYKVISPEGETISVYKDTFDPAGNLVHSKPKN